MRGAKTFDSGRHALIGDREPSSSTWNSLYKVGGIAALTIVVFMPFQMAIFIIWPPPSTVTGWFTLFEENAFVGLLDMDLLLIVDYVLLILIFLVLWSALRRTSESFIMLALILQVVSAATYFSSATAFEMLSLSNQYSAAITDDQRNILLAAGHAMLANWQGTAFNVSYVLSALALLTVSLVMIKSRPLFGKAAAFAGIAAGILGLVPSTAGQIGLVFSLISLPPLAIWLLLVAKVLLKHGPTKRGEIRK